MAELCLPPKDEHGLLLPPAEIDCIGEACPVAERAGSCFTSRHHYYWTEHYFESNGLLRAFSRHSFNTRRMAHCRHNQWHGQYDDIVVRRPRLIRPQNKVMRRFLQEASFLSQLGVSVNRIENLEVYETAGSTEEVMRDLVKIESALQRRSRIEVVSAEIAAPILERATQILEAS